VAGERTEPNGKETDEALQGLPNTGKMRKGREVPWE
jgi:hypothetical protein